MGTNICYLHDLHTFAKLIIKCEFSKKLLIQKYVNKLEVIGTKICYS